MNFDALAPHYRWMEWLLAGGKLQRCRTAFLAQLEHARHVLLLGEGNGRFLSAFRGINRFAQITVVDASAGMLRQAQRRVAAAAGEANPIEYIRADILAWPLPPRSFDLIVTHFFLDCFRPDQLESLVPRLASAARADAHWFLADFRVPPRGLARWRARWILAAMYCFFRTTTRLPARSLTPIDPLLERNGFQLQQRRSSEWGLLHADLWRRGESFNRSIVESLNR
jgi:SAM-dependent methyltransferase